MKFDPNELKFSEVHKLMIGSIVPRPIAFVSTVSKSGRNNIAPFSYFNGVCSKPPTIMFAQCCSKLLGRFLFAGCWQARD